MTMDRILARASAIQDQEVAAGADWLRAQAAVDRSAVDHLAEVLNDGDPDKIRALSDQQLRIVRNCAQLGFHVIAVRAIALQEHEES